MYYNQERCVGALTKYVPPFPRVVSSDELGAMIPYCCIQRDWAALETDYWQRCAMHRPSINADKLR